MTRFYKDRLYHFKGRSFNYIAGGGKAMQEYEAIVLGLYVGTRAYKPDCIGEWKPDGRMYRIEDGHLPDYQPKVCADYLRQVMVARHIPVATPLA